MLAVGTRAKRARVASEIAKTGFCATKQINFHGVRLHLIGNLQPKALREIADELPSGINLFGDKGYAYAQFKAELRAREIKLLTLIKKPKKKAFSYGRLIKLIFKKQVRFVRLTA